MFKFLISLRSQSGKNARLSILIYHRVLAEVDPLLPGEPDIATFSWHMRLIARYFRPLRLDEAIFHLRRGSLPSRAICVTFDDGYADNVTNALPILMQIRIPATFFIATAFLDGGRMFNDTVIETLRRLPNGNYNWEDLGLGRYFLSDIPSRLHACSKIIGQIKYLLPNEREEQAAKFAERASPLNHLANLPSDLMVTKDQVRQLNESGMLIGAHTHSHPILARLPDSIARREIIQGRDELEKIINKPVKFFAYPNGRFGKDYFPQHAKMVRDLGFDGAVSTERGVGNSASDFFQLPRFTPWDQTEMGFLFRILGNLGLTLS